MSNTIFLEIRENDTREGGILKTQGVSVEGGFTFRQGGTLGWGFFPEYLFLDLYPLKFGVYVLKQENKVLFRGYGANAYHTHSRVSTYQ